MVGCTGYDAGPELGHALLPLSIPFDGASLHVASTFSHAVSNAFTCSEGQQRQGASITRWSMFSIFSLSLGLLHDALMESSVPSV